jgi:hypothetical protein
MNFTYEIDLLRNLPADVEENHYPTHYCWNFGHGGNSTDGQWQLKVGSPAIGAGEGGTDIGMFGGEYPYVLSGLPPIPAIYGLDAQSLPSNTLDVNLKAKSHN